jgi:hypothetical protein
MKKSFILPVSLLAVFSLSYMLSQTVYASGKPSKKSKIEAKTNNTEKSDHVSQTVKTSFHAEFGAQSNIHWYQTENFDVASFYLEGQSVNAYFTKDGELEGRTFLIDWAELPFHAQVKIVQRYKDYNVDRVYVYDGNTLHDLGNYFVSLSKDNRTLLVQVNEKGNTTLFMTL